MVVSVLIANTVIGEMSSLNLENMMDLSEQEQERLFNEFLQNISSNLKILLPLAMICGIGIFSTTILLVVRGFQISKYSEMQGLEHLKVFRTTAILALLGIVAAFTFVLAVLIPVSFIISTINTSKSKIERIENIDMF